MAQKPSVPKGTRDFSPEEMVKRNYIFDTIKEVFQRYGFMPIETPAMEKLSTLMGKYGEEGDRLLFKILNSGDFMAKAGEDNLHKQSIVELTRKISEKGLRYDLTVPFARYVVQHYDKISFPFKRYQLQPVWRADRPQKGRYREFYQCDVDVIGSNSLLNEFELIQMIDEVYRKLKLNVCIQLNNRKILAGIAEITGESDKITEMTTAIDKLDKIGLEQVNKELEEKGISAKAIETLQPIVSSSGDNKEKLEFLQEMLKASEIGTKGVEELKIIFDYLDQFNLKTEVKLELSLARGLNYYTGAIIEVKSKDVEFGSITGGGRYDNLTGIFGLKDVSGVGISFGADRIYDVMELMNVFPKEVTATTKVMFVNFGKKEELFCLPILSMLRENGIHAEIYPSAQKMKKQMSYANHKNIPHVAIVGETEKKEGFISLKNMACGKQEKLSPKQLLQKLIP